MKGCLIANFATVPSIINIRDAADTNVQTGQNNLQSAKSVAQLTSALSELAKQFWEKRG
ncbi:hypothetical protein [Escherichia coli]|uniref:hypothetical protein n=1 Tax=Escherichia coli TaxID=562 RepID=UPI0020232865|nr:hypothetical protein [Escherichia coli]